MTHVTATLCVGSEVVQTFAGSSISSEHVQLSNVILQLKEVREQSNAAISELMKQYPDEGKDIDIEEEGEGEEAAEEPEKKESKKKRKLDKRKKSQIATKMVDAYIPEYVLAKVFSFLPLATLVRTSHVCSSWRQAFKYDFIWQEQRRVFLGLIDPPDMAQAGISHKDQFLREYSAPIKVYIVPKIGRMSCFAEGMPDLETCITKQFQPNTRLNIVKERLFQEINEKLDPHDQKKFDDVELAACLNGLFNTTICTPLLTVLLNATDIQTNRDNSATEYARQTLDNLSNHGIVNVRQILSFTLRDFVEREVSPEMALLICRVLGKVSTWANLRENSHQWAQQTLRQCGIKSGCALKLITVLTVRPACSHYYEIFLLPDSQKIPSALNYPRYDD
eukprot:Phypoly_transcript_03252.p1 GENE.Phypoly_transcript_03252~~Phypoly_transcript_03252.p1  ORF type:complete len:392 (+),score=49.36 Phypoly_transcript_03252:1250-2425(+)